MSAAGDKFRQMRRILDLSQPQMAEMMGVTTLTIHKWEKKEPKFSSDQIDTMLAIGLNPMYCYTDVSMYWLGFKEAEVRKYIKKRFKEQSNS